MDWMLRSIFAVLATALAVVTMWIAQLDMPFAWPYYILPTPPPGGQTYSYGRVDDELVFQISADVPRREYLAAPKTDTTVFFGDRLPKMREYRLFSGVRVEEKWQHTVREDPRNPAFNYYDWFLFSRYRISIWYLPALWCLAALPFLFISSLRRAATWWLTLPIRIARHVRGDDPAPAFPVILHQKATEKPDGG